MGKSTKTKCQQNHTDLSGQDSKTCLGTIQPRNKLITGFLKDLYETSKDPQIVVSIKNKVYIGVKTGKLQVLMSIPGKVKTKSAYLLIGNSKHLFPLLHYSSDPYLHVFITDNHLELGTKEDLYFFKSIVIQVPVREPNKKFELVSKSSVPQVTKYKKIISSFLNLVQDEEVKLCKKPLIIQTTAGELEINRALL